MKKRFTDIHKWDAWFRKLPCEHKAFWFFIHDHCDEVGVWDVDFDKAEFYIGSQLEIEELKKSFLGKIASFENDLKWWVIDYVRLQYKELRLPTSTELAENPKLKFSPVKRYIKLLNEHGLYLKYIETLTSSSNSSSYSSSSSYSPHLGPTKVPPNWESEPKDNLDEKFDELNHEEVQKLKHDEPPY